MKPGISCSGLLLWLLLPAMLLGQEVASQEVNLEIVFKSLRPTDRKTLSDGYTAMCKVVSTAEKQRIDSLFAGLQRYQIPVVPEQRDFILCVSRLGAKPDRANLNVWLEGMHKAMSATERKRTAIREYLSRTVGLATEQTVYADHAHKWQVRGEVGWQLGNPIRITFEAGELMCATPKDTIRILNTSGSFELGKDYIDGKGGTVGWKAPGLVPSAELSGYRIDLKLSGYTADSVRFCYPGKFAEPLTGRLRDNALKYKQEKGRLFPEFTSYAFDIRIDSLFPDVSYCGGISYAGLKFTGTGSDECPATVRIAPNDTLQLELSSRQFLVDSLRIVSGKAAMEIAMDSGTITHPDINFFYSQARRQVAIKRITEQSLHIPFKDTYHAVLLGVEEIYWTLDSSYMEMNMSSRSGLFKATIESLNFFSDDVYDRLQGMDEINPLNGLLKCSIAENSDVFTIADYAAFLRKPADQLRKQIVLLSYNDFVEYNEVRDEVKLKQRLYDYTKARVGKQDYDNLRFVSHPKDSRVNARLDVRNFNLHILGVEQFLISAARRIYVSPSDRKVVMMKNRDMLFNGKLNAGMFDMYGSNLFFSYDKYRIQLPKVDSASMYLAGKNKNLRGGKVKSLIRDMTGEIVIDKPGNKSGKASDPGYPLLNSSKESYVYFDDPDIQQGRYKRDKFYYVIEPYTIKGINDAGNFRYAFYGTLVSDIVSPIRDTLRLMKDHALGLTYRIPASGLALYGKGKIYDRITLNRSGFVASGKVELNHSHFRSDTILMLPGCMLAGTPEIEAEAIPGQRPAGEGKEVKIRYVAEQGELQVTSTRLPLDIYAGRVKHEGTLSVYEDKLDASGKLELEGAALHSGLFHLQPDRILSDKSSLQLAALSDREIQLNTSDVKAEIDLSADKGKFVNNTRTNQAVFSSSKYACSFKSFTWYMKEAFLNIGVEEDARLQKLWQIEEEALLPVEAQNIFVSTDPAADSLRFVAPSARYDLKNGVIDGQAVNHIDIANGRFYPIDGKVSVQTRGDITPFTGGKLLCERTDSTKWLYRVDLKLKGRKQFSGSGDFTYVNQENKEQIVRFTEIGLDTLGEIVARTLLEEDRKLSLNDGLDFKGKLTLLSRQRDLAFDGFVGLTADRSFLKHAWMAINTSLDARNISIPAEVENRDDQKQRIFNGIYLHTDKVFRPYAAFMSNRRFYKDDLLIGGRGRMEWFAPLKQYIVRDTSVDKFYRFSYDPATSVVSAFGKLNLNMGMAGIEQRWAGAIRYDLKEEQLNIDDMLCLLDFSLLKKMENVLLKNFSVNKLKAIRMNRYREQKMNEIFGESFSGMEKRLKRPVANVPDSLNQLFVLDSLNFIWNTKTHSYTADGEVNVVAMRGNPIGKTMNIKMELVRGRFGNQFFMYIYDDQMWYYFEYADKSIYTLSSDAVYNDILRTEKADKKVVRNDRKEALYTITLCPDSKKNRFLERIKQ